MKTNSIKINNNTVVDFKNQVDFCVGTGRMGLALQKEYMDQLKLVQGEIGFKHIRGHGLFTDDMAIYQKRKEFTDGFLPVFQRIYNELSKESEIVNIEYKSHAAEGDLLQLISSSRERDKIMGFSLKGVHRDELELKLNDYPIKREGSQGQNKTFLISMKLAQFDYLKEKGQRGMPILLLDDIFDKLDEYRVEQIVKMVSSNRFGQIFITDTNSERLDKIIKRQAFDHKLFRVEEGVVSDVSD